jgi:hypothetical protein
MIDDDGLETARVSARIDVSNPFNSRVYVDDKLLYPVTQVELRCGVDRPTELVLRIPIIEGEIDVNVVNGYVHAHRPNDYEK